MSQTCPGGWQRSTSGGHTLRCLGWRYVTLEKSTDDPCRNDTLQCFHVFIDCKQLIFCSYTVSKQTEPFDGQEPKISTFVFLNEALAAWHKRRCSHTMGIRQEQELDPGLLDFLAATDSDKVEHLLGFVGWVSNSNRSRCIAKLHVEAFVTPNQMAREAGRRWKLKLEYGKCLLSTSAQDDAPRCRARFGFTGGSSTSLLFGTPHVWREQMI